LREFQILQLLARWPACNYFHSYFSQEGRRFSGREKRIWRWEKKHKKHLQESERE
jgi:1,6-anhydro-N-acetylmuramate kinase